MLNLKNMTRLIVATILSLLVVGSAFSLGPGPCTATSPGPLVNMYEKPSIHATVVNVLTVDHVYRVIDATKLPSELEPEGIFDLWLYLKPNNGTPRGWVRYSEVIVSGDCSKYGI